MGIVSGLVKVGLAKKAFDEARKPKNQERLRQLWGRVRGSGGRRATREPRR